MPILQGSTYTSTFLKLVGKMWAILSVGKGHLLIFYLYQFSVIWSFDKWALNKTWSSIIDQLLNIYRLPIRYEWTYWTIIGQVELIANRLIESLSFHLLLINSFSGHARTMYLVFRCKSIPSDFLLKVFLQILTQVDRLSLHRHFCDNVNDKRTSAFPHQMIIFALTCIDNVL